jgi:hypothetical protein
MALLALVRSDAPKKDFLEGEATFLISVAFF